MLQLFSCIICTDILLFEVINDVYVWCSGPRQWHHVCYVCLVERQDEKYSLEVHYTHMFDSIRQLLSFYKENNLPNRHTKLSKPYSELMGSLPSWAQPIVMMCSTCNGWRAVWNADVDGWRAVWNADVEILFFAVICNVCYLVCYLLCTIKSRRFLLALAHLGSPRKRAVKWLCMCVCCCYLLPPPSWIFQVWLKRVELCRRAKFGRNRSNCGRDIAILWFFPKWRPSAILDLLCVFGPPTKGTCWFLSLCKIWLESMK